MVLGNDEMKDEVRDPLLVTQKDQNVCLPYRQTSKTDNTLLRNSRAHLRRHLLGTKASSNLKGIISKHPDPHPKGECGLSWKILLGVALSQGGSTNNNNHRKPIPFFESIVLEKDQIKTNKTTTYLGLKGQS